MHWKQKLILDIIKELVTLARKIYRGMKKLILMLAVVGMMMAGCKNECGEWEVEDGDDCTEFRKIVEGTYSGNLTSGSVTIPASWMVRTEGSDPRDLRVDNQFDIRLSGGQDFEIEQQTFSENGQYFTIHGDGDFSTDGYRMRASGTITQSGHTLPFSFNGTQ